MTLCTLIAKAHGVPQLEIICIMYHQSSMPGRVTRLPMSPSGKRTDAKVKYLGRLVPTAIFKR